MSALQLLTVVCPQNLDDVVMVAREACDDLSAGTDGDDDVIVDERDRAGPVPANSSRSKSKELRK